MAEKRELKHPRMVAVWPGMGNVALNAGVYLLAKLDMQLIAELNAGDLFDVDHVEVRKGVVQPGRRPRSRFFLWRDPRQQHDLVLFLGEAQPPIGKYAFCRQLIDFGQELGVERYFTFAAMVTQLHPAHQPRVFGAATDTETLEQLSHQELQTLDDGQISGLNGVLLGAAAERGLPGTCLLGELPHVLAQIPFPKASMAILEVFVSITGIELDFGELAEQVKIVEQQIQELIDQIEQAYGQQTSHEPPDLFREQVEEERISAADRQRLEQLFAQAQKDRAKAFELKQELDRLDVFKEFEDRFLDLFKKPDE